MGVAASFLPSTLPRPFPAPQHPPGACVIRSRPDLARGPGPGGKSSLPSLSWSRSGSRETPSPWVIYRGCPGAVSCPFLPPPRPVDCWALSAHLVPPPGCTHGGSSEGLGESFPGCLGTKVLSPPWPPSRPLSSLSLSLALTVEVPPNHCPLPPPIIWPERGTQNSPCLTKSIDGHKSQHHLVHGQNTTNGSHRQCLQLHC